MLQAIYKIWDNLPKLDTYMLLQKSEIVARIEELESNLKNSILWSKQSMIRDLKNIVSSDDSSNTEKIQAIKHACTMLKYDEEIHDLAPPTINITFTQDN